MRFLIFFNLIAIVVIGAALARMYQGTPLPWQLRWSDEIDALSSQPLPAVQPSPPPAPRSFAVPEENPKRAPQKAVEMPAPAPDTHVLRFLTEGSYPPFNERNSAGDLVGYDVDMAKAICEHLHRPCEIEARSWNDLLPALRRGDGDAVIASMLIGSPAS